MADQTKTNIIRQKMSRALVTGFKCATCLVETVIYGNDPAPTTCLNCGTAKPVQKWKNLIINTTTVEVVD